MSVKKILKFDYRMAHSLFQHYFYIIVFLLVVFSVLYILYYKKIENFDQSQSQSQRETQLVVPDIDIKDTGIYLINLDRNPDRLESFIEQYMMCDLRYKQFQRISAVDGAKIPDIEDVVSDAAYGEIQQIEKTGYRTKHYQLTRGAIGCYLSHLKAYELIAMGNDDYGLVFEDDVFIDKNIFKRLNKLLAGIPNDWDMLLLGCHCILCDKYDVYYDTRKFFLMHCYIVKKTSASRLWALLKREKIKQQIDSEISDLVSTGSIKIYCLRESLAKQSGVFSTNIQTPLKVMPGIDPYVTLI